MFLVRIFVITLFLTSCVHKSVLEKDSGIDRLSELVMEKKSISIEGDERTYSVLVPKTSDSIKGIFFLFHGSNGSGAEFSMGTGFNEQVIKENYIAVYPDAPIGNWAEGCNCNNADRLEIKDLEFVDGIIDYLTTEYKVVDGKNYAIGFSQGGLFTQRLACERSKKFDGFAVIAANMSKPLSVNCTPESKVSQLIIQGKFDKVLNYEGSDNGALSLLSAKETIEFWAEQNECALETKKIHEGNSNISVTTYCDEDKQSNLRLITVLTGTHSWFFYGINTNEEIVNFLLKKGN
jgi:polyhydroxybutyrate depolymerase